MVSQPPVRTERAALATECLVALAIIAIALLPLSLVFLQESKAAQASFYRAAALQIVDGEMEILVAGEWRAFPPGSHPYPVRAASATNLPPGQFTLLRQDRTLRLQWIPKRRGSGGAVSREVTLP